MGTKIKPALKGHSRAVVASVALLATLILLLSSMFFGISNADEGVDIPNTSADLNDNGEEYLSIVGANLELSDYLHIIYGVDRNLGEGEYSEVKMLFWNSAQSAYEFGTHIAVRDKRNNENTTIRIGDAVYDDCVTFLSDGIAAKEIGDVIYARAYVTDSEGEIKYSNVVKYSVLDYVYSRYRDAELYGNVAPDQIALYNSILTYGAKAQVVFNYNTTRLATSHGARIEVEGGRISDGFNSGTYLTGDVLTLVADMESEHGRFRYWIGPDGENVGSDRVLKITVDNATVGGTYTAVYTGVTTVNVVGGMLLGGNTSGAFVNGSEYTITVSNTATFSHWVDETGANLGTSASLTFTAGEGTVTKTYTAVHFQPATVIVNGGTLYGDDGDGNVTYGETFRIVAEDKSADKKVFKAWVDADGAVVSTDATYENTVVPALAGQTLTYTATYYDPTTVSVTDGTVNGAAQATVAYGDSYTVTAADKSADKFVFKHWTDGVSVVSTDSSFTAEADVSGATKNYTAVYYAPSTITVTGGTVNGAAQATVTYGQSYTVTATVPGGYVFARWTENGEATAFGESFTATAGEGETINYTATFIVNSGAGFENNSGSLTSGTPIISNGYTVTLNGSSASFGASVTTNPTDSSDKVLSFVDADTELDHGDVSIGILGEGSFVRFKTDVYFDSFSTGSILYVSFGDAYKLRFTAVEDTALKIYDVSKPGDTEAVGYLDKFVRPGEWIEISVIVTSGAGVNGKAPRAYVFVGDTCIAESYNVAQVALSDSVSITAAKTTTVSAYFDDIQAYRLDMSPSDEEAITPDTVFEEVTTSSSNRLQNVEMLLGKEAADKLAAMDRELFSEAVYLWAAELYDPETGGFYFSISGRDNYGYLADLETTSQMTGVLNQLGIGSYDSLLNAEQKAAMLSWAQSLESNRDGYSYHPQWGISIGDNRRSRDYTYSSASYSPSGSLRFRLYNDANYRLSGGTSGSKGVTIPVEYDNSGEVKLSAYINPLTAPLGVSVQKAVSKVILASASTGESNTPVHLRSEEAFVGYINGKWNSGCKETGTHERHLCTNSCVQVDDPNDSYMELVNGKVVFTRGQRCISCHECKHTVGHSYGFASVIGTQNSQIKSLGLGDLLVMYYYDVQENVQASLRHKVELAYTGNDGEYAWEALPEEYKAAKAQAVDSITEEAMAKAKIEYNYYNGHENYDNLTNAEKAAFDALVIANYDFNHGEGKFNSLKSNDQTNVLTKERRYVYNDGNGAFALTTDAEKEQLYRMAQAELDFVAEVNTRGSEIWTKEYTAEEREMLKKANQNGIWEEPVTYNTISGLLKACSTPGAHGYEFLYAEDAIQSALECALFTVWDYTKQGESVVSIYNPFNAINGVFGNIRSYGTDKTVVDRCMALVRSQAAELIENTTGKLKGYCMPDGGFSYSYGGYCTTSQGQPVAVNGWNNGQGEGDVNGTALAFGTRSALLSVLGVSVDKVYAGENNKIEGGFDLDGDGSKTDEFDLDGDGVAEVLEATCTHSQRFQYLITTKAQIEKVDVYSSEEAFTYTFEDGVKGSGGEIITESGTTNKVLKVVDDKSASGVYANFSGSLKSGEKNTSKVSFKMKVVESNNITSHQIFLPGLSGGGNVLKIDMEYSNGTFTFKNVISDNNKTPLGISVTGTEWFTVEIETTEEGFEVNGTTCYGTFKVTQGATTVSAYLTELIRKDGVSGLNMYSLSSALTTTLYDDVSVVATVKGDIYDGEYHFDTVSQAIAGSDVIVDNPVTKSYDRVYLLNGNGGSFAAYNYSVDDYTTSNVRYNFDYSQLGLLLNKAKDGDRIDIVMLDNAGKKITGIYLVVKEYQGNKLVYFHAPNGKVLQESIPRTTVDSEGKTVTKAELREMILDVNTAKWMTIKLEYHYDMAHPQLDVVVRYADDTKNGYYTTTAACLTDVDVCESSADAYNFANLSIKATGMIYLDDLYIRNVYDPCDGTHVFIKKATKAFFTGETLNGHKVYCTSCQKCGAKGDETFVVHNYVKEASDAYKVYDATIYSPAVYREHCEVCGQLSDTTFTYGYPLDDPSKHNFSTKDEQGNVIKDDKIPNYLTYNLGGGKWSTVMEEKVGDVVNYYLNIGKDYYYVEYTGSRYVKITVEGNTIYLEDVGLDRYVMDETGNYVLDENGSYVKYGEKYYDPGTSHYMLTWVKKDNKLTPNYTSIEDGSYSKTESGSYVPDENGSYVKISNNGTNMVKFRYVLDSGEAIANKYIYEFDFRWLWATEHSNDVIYAKIGTSGEKGNVGAFEASSSGNYVNYHGQTFYSGEWHSLKYLFARTVSGDSWEVSVFIDGVKVSSMTFEGSGVPYVALETRYPRTESGVRKANNMSFDIDRLKVTKVESVGHSAAEIVDGRYLKTPATCETPAEYYKSCSLCGEKLDETFTVGTVTGHEYGNVLDDKYLKTPAGCESPAVYYKSCKLCGKKSATETFTVGSGLGHNDVKTTVTAATKEAAEVCYFTCQRCGRKTESASYGDPLSWTFDKDALPSNMKTSAFASGGNLPATGRWERVTSDEVNGALNYYLRVNKKDTSGSNIVRFHQEYVEGVTEYIYEYDFRWGGTTEQNSTEVMMVKIMYDLTSTSDTNRLDFPGYAYSSSVGANLKFFNKNSGLCTKGEWVTMKWVLKQTDTVNNKWKITCSVQGTEVFSQTYTLAEGKAGNVVPVIMLESRSGTYDMYYDIDNVYIWHE